jgi:general stress protein YciG
MQNERDEQGQMSDTEQNEMEMDERAQGEQESAARGASGRGFAGMSEEKRKEIASKGGKSQGKGNNPGNFANNREKAVAAGRVGGQNSHGGGRQSGDDSEE